VAALGGVAFLLTRGPPAVSLDRVEFSGAPSTFDQSEVATVSAKAFDSTGTDQTANTSFSWSASPASAFQIAATGVNYTVRVTAIQSGSVSLSAAATWRGLSKTGSLSVTVQALHFELTAQNPVSLLNQPDPVTVRALRPNNTVATSYRGTVNFTASDLTSVTLPPNGTFAPFDLGRKLFDVTVRKSGSLQITARDILAPTITGTMSLIGNQKPLSSFVITPTAANPLQIATDGTASSDPDGQPLSYAWSWGDAGSGSGISSSHTYSRAGTYAINLTVQDSYLASDTMSQSYHARAPPVAGFRVTLLDIGASVANLTVNGSASLDSDGFITMYNWTWDDGSFSQGSGTEATHSYGASYLGQRVRVTLRTTDNDALSNSVSRNVTLRNEPPTAAFSYQIDQTNRTVYVDASASDDVNANLVYYNWTWGDGQRSNGTSATASHAYSADGTYTVNLTAVDSTDLRGYNESAITILQPQVAPYAAFTYSRSRMHVDVDASPTYDPNGDLRTYAWTWGDGSTSPASTSPIASHDYTAAGVNTITLTATDSGGRQGTATRKVTVGASSLDFQFYDFFNVPYGEWWDYRTGVYGDLPINAECFNATSIATTACTPSLAGVNDVETYPYTDWYPLPGAVLPGNPNNNALIYAPFRLRAVGSGLPGYNRSEPVFLPVLNYSAAPGNQLDFDWRMHYLDTAGAGGLRNVGCPVTVRQMDGFIIRSKVTVTLDLQESRRIFGVVAADASAAQSWWNTHLDPACNTLGSVELDVENWLTTLGNGKYDVVSSFEYEYTPFFTNMSATVDAGTGVTTVTIDHVAWATEVLMSRWFYWGNVSYQANYLDSTKAAGWWGMELAWFEDFSFAGSLGAATVDFTLNTIMQYQFQLLSLPGPNGQYDRADDVPYWTWGPILTDYTNDYTPTHLISELDRYPDPPYAYIHTTPGSRQYNVSRTYDYAPLAWDLKAGQTWHFAFPNGNVVFYNPNLTPIGQDPSKGGFVEIRAPLKYYRTDPASYGEWSAQAYTWDVLGPSATGGPPGSPGADGIAGTADDRYALTPWGAILFVPTTAQLVASIAASSSPVSMGSGVGQPVSAALGWTSAGFAPATVVARSSSVRSRDWA
jgi:PKD repeat protein